MNHNWKYKRLGDLCEIVRGGSPRPIKDYITEDGNGLNWIKIGDVAVGSKYITSTKEKIKSEGLSKTRQVYKGDFILSNSMSFGRPYILKIDGCIHDGWLAIKGVDNHFIPDFLYYFLSSPQTYSNFEKLAKGGVVNNLNSDSVRTLIIPIPSNLEQRKIVVELDKLNELIEIKRNQLKDLDTLAQSLFYETFGDPLENPKGLEISTIGDVTSVQTGATPSREISEYFIGDIPWIKTTEVQNCDIYETEEHISQSALDNSNCKLFPPNTIIIAMYGQGKTRGQIARLKIEACTNQACAAILPCSKLNPLFLYAFLRSSYGSLRDIAVGCNQKNLNLSLVKNYTIFLPPIQLQNEFASKIEAVEEQKRLIESSIVDLETLLASRMDYWFND